MSDPSGPTLYVRLTDEEGKDLSAIRVLIPRGLSARVAHMHALEVVSKALKKAMGDAIKGLGFK